MESYYIVDTVASWFTIVFMFITFYKLMPSKKFTLPFGFVLSIANGIFYYLSRYSTIALFVELRNNEIQMTLLSLCFFASIILFVIIGFSCSIKRKCKVIITMLLVDILVECITSFVVINVLRIDPAEVKTPSGELIIVNFISILFIYAVMCFVVYCICRKKRPEYSNKITLSVIAMSACFIFFFCILVNFHHIYYDEKVFSVLFTLSLFFLVIFIVSVFAIIKYSVEMEHKKADIYWTKEMQNLTIEKIKESLKNDEKIRKIKHDYRDQMLFIKMLIEKNTDESLKKADEILTSAESEITAVNSAVYSDNISVNIILGAKVAEADKKKIKIIPEISVGEKFCAEQERNIDLLIINLLNNAIEACEQNKDINKKYVNFYMQQKANYLFVKTVNPCEMISVNKKGKLVTSKKDKINHGIGNNIINSIVTQYGGKDEIMIDENIFTHSVCIELM